MQQNHQVRWQNSDDLLYFLLLEMKKVWCWCTHCNNCAVGLKDYAKNPLWFDIKKESGDFSNSESLESLFKEPVSRTLVMLHSHFVTENSLLDGKKCSIIFLCSEIVLKHKTIFLSHISLCEIIFVLAAVLLRTFFNGP